MISLTINPTIPGLTERIYALKEEDGDVLIQSIHGGIQTSVPIIPVPLQVGRHHPTVPPHHLEGGVAQVFLEDEEGYPIP